METDQLIRTLAADNAHRARPVGFVLMLALMAAAPVSLAIFLTELGVRPDVMTAMRNPFFDLKFAVTLALAISAIAVSLHLSRPEASLRGFGWLLLIPVGLLVAGIGGEMMMPQRLPMMTRLMGNNSRICLTSIPLMSLPLLAAALIGLASRRAGTARGGRRDRRTAVGGPGGDALRLALHRRFAAVRGDLVHDRRRAGHGGRRAGGIEGAAVLNFAPGTRRPTDAARRRRGASAACGGSAAPAGRSRTAAVHRWPCRPQDRSAPRPRARRAC